MEEKELEKLNVLYEDNQVIVVIKPQNMPSQEDESGDLDLLNLVKAYVKLKYNKPGEVFIGLVHRLDRPTGGIMVFARNSKSAARLSEQIANSQMNKTYYAVCNGCPNQKFGTLINYLKKNEKDNIVKVVTRSETGAKRAELNFNVLQTVEDKSLLEIKIVTGRSHQIRVQMAAINCPLVGDNKYGKNKTKASVNLGLWAGKLEFIHPTTKQKMTFVAMPDVSKKPWSDFRIEKFIKR